MTQVDGNVETAELKVVSREEREAKNGSPFLLVKCEDVANAFFVWDTKIFGEFREGFVVRAAIVGGEWPKIIRAECLGKAAKSKTKEGEVKGKCGVPLYDRALEQGKLPDREKLKDAVQEHYMDEGYCMLTPETLEIETDGWMEELEEKIQAGNETEEEEQGEGEVEEQGEEEEEPVDDFTGSEEVYEDEDIGRLEGKVQVDPHGMMRCV